MGLPLIQGTLDLIILGTIRSGPVHGYAIATTIDDRSDGRLQVEDAALYQALHRLERQGLIEAEWGASENNRRARFYSLTPKGRRRLAEQTTYWRNYARALDAVLEGA
jgi:transcriptional regulator